MPVRVRMMELGSGTGAGETGVMGTGSEMGDGVLGEEAMGPPVGEEPIGPAPPPIPPMPPIAIGAFEALTGPPIGAWIVCRGEDGGSFSACSKAGAA